MRALASALLLSVAACASDPLAGLESGTGPAVSDEQLRALALSTGGWTYYKNSQTPIVRESNPHPGSALVRYNPKAATQLDATGKVRASASFPDSSVIVKELYSGSTLRAFTVMLKLRGSASAGFDGWVWGEYLAGGGVQYSTSGRGAACSACHSVGIDYTRMNDSHP
jgi:hypothetical protein